MGIGGFPPWTGAHTGKRYISPVILHRCACRWAPPGKCDQPRRCEICGTHFSPHVSRRGRPHKTGNQVRRKPALRQTPRSITTREVFFFFFLSDPRLESFALLKREPLGRLGGRRRRNMQSRSGGKWEEKRNACEEKTRRVTRKYISFCFL